MKKNTIVDKTAETQVKKMFTFHIKYAKVYKQTKEGAIHNDKI